MDPLWNPWVAMGIVGALAALLAWIESKRKPVNERIATKGTPPEIVKAATTVIEVTEASIEDPKVTSGCSTCVGKCKQNNNTSVKKQKRQRNRRRRNRSRN